MIPTTDIRWRQSMADHRHPESLPPDLSGPDHPHGSHGEPMTGHQLPVEAISRIVAVLSQEPHVQRVVLYGSRAKGCAKPGSDIDLAIEAPGAERTILLRLDQELDDLLLPWMIDLNFLHLIHNQDLRDHIDRVGVTWFVRNAAHRESHRKPTLTDSTPHLL